MRRIGRTALILTLALASFLPACAQRPASRPSAPAPRVAQPETTSPELPLGESMMPFAQRRAEMPAGMPVEIPVIAGSVVSTSAPVSDSTWLYTIDTSGTVASVTDWYLRAYENAGWRLESSKPDADSYDVRLRKGGAETVLHVGESDGLVRVDASIGVGERAPSAF